MRITFILVSSILIACTSFAQNTITIDQFEATGISGLRAHWDMAIPLSENGKRVITDKKLTDRGGTAVWNGKEPGPLSCPFPQNSVVTHSVWNCHGTPTHRIITVTENSYSGSYESDIRYWGVIGGPHVNH